MSFHNQGIWMTKNAGSMNGGDMTNDNSKIESKRPHQWFMDGPEVDLFPNKKQAVEVSNDNLLSGMFGANASSWGNSSSFHLFAGHFTEPLFDQDAVTMATNFDNRILPSVSVNVGRKDNMDPFGSNSSFGLSISHTLEDPPSGLNYGGIRKDEVSEVKESDNVMSVPTSYACERVVNNTLSNPCAYNKGGDNSLTMNLTYNKGDESIMLMNEANGRTDDFISIGQYYNRVDDSLSVDQTHKEISNIISMDHALSRDDCNMISVAQVYKANDNSMSRDHIFNRGEDGTITVGHNACHDSGNDMLAVGHSYNERESTIISFGGCDDDDISPSGRLISCYELLMGQAPTQRSKTVNEKVLVKSNGDSLLSTALTFASETVNISKTKEEPKMSKKVPSNNFPSNVRSLLSTGMLDGVPVKYMAWSREKELRGVIKDSGYLCSCQSCNFTKVINAYEFERHAGCKTKHPNNHIYFENGKTIYGIVQELRSTPQNILFEVIQTITGSPINQKSFRIWKESVLAATRELQRIYGKDEVQQLS